MGQPAPVGADLKWTYDPIPPLLGYCWGIPRQWVWVMMDLFNRIDY